MGDMIRSVLEGNYVERKQGKFDEEEIISRETWRIFETNPVRDN